MPSLPHWLRALYPAESPGPLRERLLSAGLAGLGVLAVSLLSSLWLNAPLPIVAAVGASAVLVFCLPSAPLSQPWPVLMGYLTSGLAGVAAFKTGWPMPLAVALAVALAAFAMLSLRCLHPPGGAVALTAVIGGERMTDLGFTYVLSPVLANALLIIAVGVLLNTALPGRHYPRRPIAPEAHRRHFSSDDLHKVLRDYGHPLDISDEELDALITRAEARAREARPAKHPGATAA